MANTGNLQVVMDLTSIEGAGYAPATDALKILSDVLDLIEGAGFATGTDSLKQLSDVLDLITARLNVPGADAVTNTYMRDVIGNKTDVEKSDVSATASVMAYQKGQIQELDQRKIAKVAYLNRPSGNNQANADVVNINDKGVLTGITLGVRNMTAGALRPLITLTIDGVNIGMAHVMEFTAVDQIVQTISFPFNHRFNTSLRVQICTDAATNTIMNCYCTYTIDD